MNEPKLHITRRILPHWTLDGSSYFVTFRLAGKPDLNADERKIILELIREGDGVDYHLAAAVVMPDHVHIILRPMKDMTLPKVMQRIKGRSALLVNSSRKTSGRLWQRESFDRILRDEQEFQEKLQYLADNPLKAGLISPHETYDAWLTGSEFQT